MVPPVTPRVTRVDEMTVLRGTFTETLSFEKHITQICCKARQSLCALRILKDHGFKGSNLFEVVQTTRVALMMYGSPAQCGFALQPDKNRLQSIMGRLIRLGYHPGDSPTFDQLCRQADNGLVSAVLKNLGHVLYKLLPPRNPLLILFNHVLMTGS